MSVPSRGAECTTGPERPFRPAGCRTCPGSVSTAARHSAMRIGNDAVWRWAPPFVVWLVAQTLVMVVAARAGYDPWSPSTWNRWDSGHYLSIAERGPELFRCGDLIPNRAPDDWCGSAGWLPLYPLIVAVVVALSPLDLLWAAWLVPVLVHLSGLSMAWRLIGRISPVGPVRRVMTLMLIAVTPGMAWAHAMFPISLLLALIWAGALLAMSGRRSIAGFVFGLAAVTHSMGFALVPVVGVWLLWTGRERIVRAVLSGVLLAAPVIALGVFQQVALGRWNANLLAVASYGHRIGLFPVIAARRVGQLVADVVPIGSRWPAAQEGLVVVVITLAVGVLVREWRRHPDALDPTEVLLVAMGAAMWASLASFDGDVAFWRVAAGATPCLVALRRLPVWMLSGLIVACGVVAVPIASRFTLGWLY